MADQMAKTPQAALSFMRGIVPPARQRVLNEQAEIQNVIFMGLNCLNIKRACIRIFLLIFPWWLDCQRFITASLLMF